MRHYFAVWFVKKYRPLAGKHGLVDKALNFACSSISFWQFSVYLTVVLIFVSFHLSIHASSVAQVTSMLSTSSALSTSIRVSTNSPLHLHRLKVLSPTRRTSRSSVP